MKKIIILLMLVAVATAGFSKVKKETIYIYGFSASFTDSTVYFTNVQKLDSAYLTNKGFLVGRADYSAQLKSYLQMMLGVTNPTVMVGFSTNKAKAEAKYMKQLKRYKKQKNAFIVKQLADNEFIFQTVGNPDSPDEADMPKQPKQKKGKRPEGMPPGGKPGGHGGGGMPPSGGGGGMPGGGMPPSM